MVRFGRSVQDREKRRSSCTCWHHSHEMRGSFRSAEAFSPRLCRAWHQRDEVLPLALSWSSLKFPRLNLASVNGAPCFCACVIEGCKLGNSRFPVCLCGLLLREAGGRATSVHSCAGLRGDGESRVNRVDSQDSRVKVKFLRWTITRARLFHTLPFRPHRSLSS